MPHLEIVDLKDVHIAAYTGDKGTNLYSNLYAENEIPASAFYDLFTSGKGSLTSFVFPLSATSIGKSAFLYCSGLNAASIPSSINTIGQNAFANCGKLSNVNISEGVESIESGAFNSCTFLTSVTIPSSVKSIGSNAFKNCSSLNSLVISEEVQTIGDAAFSDCKSLTSVIIPSTVSSIGISAFANCQKLTSATIPEGVTSIGAWAFDQCKSLTSITIPSSVTLINNFTFSWCEQLTTVILSEGLTSIGMSAFYDCPNLASITIPSTVDTIENNAFSSCSNLASVILSEGVTTIGSYVFAYCSVLNSILIPSSVTSIGTSAFMGNYSLGSITVFRSIPIDLQLSPSLFMDVNKTTCKLYVPYGSKELYAAADQWKDFINIIEFDGSVVNPSIIVDKGAPDQVIDLKTVFNDESLISCTVTSNTNQQVVKATIAGSELTLDFSSEYIGNTEILISALSNGKEVKSTFKVEVKLPTGIDSPEANPVLLGYPNPTRGEVHVKLNSLPAFGTKLSIYNASGKVIYTTLITKKEETIDLQGNPPGVYFIKIGKKANENFKIVLQ